MALNTRAHQNYYNPSSLQQASVQHIQPEGLLHKIEVRRRIAVLCTNPNRQSTSSLGPRLGADGAAPHGRGGGGARAAGARAVAAALH